MNSGGILETWWRGPAHPMKMRLFRWALKGLRRREFVVPIGESRLRVSTGDYIGERLIYGGTYEPRTLALARNILRHGGIFVDVGANLGLFSILMSENPSTRVIAIEPDAFNFLRLRENVRANRRENVTLCDFALSSGSRVLPFELPVASNLATVRVAAAPPRLAHGAGPAGTAVLKAAVSFDFLAGVLGIKEVDLMKIDVEGHEIAVLEGVDFTAPYRPKNIVCEFLDHGVHTGGKGRQDIYEFLQKKGYAAFDIEGRRIHATSDVPEANALFRAE